MNRTLSAIVLVLAITPVFALEHSDLSNSEKESLTEAAYEVAGIGVWQIQGKAIRQDSGVGATARVVFDPASYSGYCLAPSALFTATSLEAEVSNWRTTEGSSPEYRFWFQSCDDIDTDPAIVLNQIVNVGVLEQIRDQKSRIVSDALELLSPGHGYDVAISKHRIRSIRVRFDQQHGVVYQLQYEATSCRGISTEAVIESDVIKLVSTSLWLC